ncbi:hypothetical protein ACFV08_22745, partial [Streptomyces fradiae]|uniref:hypothetical protein n=1 Tax=Streptomyces fradiae TaxID=1906 RepID=UPI0036873E6E
PGGPPAAAASSAQAPRAAGPAGAAPGTPGDAPPSGTGRRITLPTGYEMHPWADLRPAGEGAATPPGRRLWHQSQGSAG